MIILVDLDSVLADFEQGFLKAWKDTYPDRPFVEVTDRKTFYVEDQYPKQYLQDIKELKQRPGFFATLPLVTGAKAAIKLLVKKGHAVFICSSPLTSYQNCVEEKYQWVEKNLGNEWVKRLIIAKDKTLIIGDILIDDRPEIIGSVEPRWKHIIFEAPYNQAVKNRRRVTWQNWQKVLGI